jgi:hypothetical protein
LLNSTARRIWELLATPHTPDELLAVLMDEFDAPPEALRADIEALLGELGSKGLVGADVSPMPPTGKSRT